MDKQLVMEQFAALARLDPEAAMDCSGLVDTALWQVDRALRADADREKNAGVLAYLCAALAYYRFALLCGTDEESVRALDVSVTRKPGDRLKNAGRVRDDALVLAAEFLTDPGFYFGRTAE